MSADEYQSGAQACQDLSLSAALSVSALDSSLEEQVQRASRA